MAWIDLRASEGRLTLSHRYRRDDREWQDGMLYGPLWGTVITWTGAMLGAYAAFALARAFGRPFVLAMLAERHHEALDSWALRQGAGALLFSRSSYPRPAGGRRVWLIEAAPHEEDPQRIVNLSAPA